MDVYQTPISSTEEETNPYREIVIGWEKLRLRYNLILLIPGLLTLVIWIHQDLSQLILFIIPSIFFAIGANCCYLLGPLAELYGKALSKDLHLRRLLYWAGVIFSILIIAGFAILASITTSFGLVD